MAWPALAFACGLPRDAQGCPWAAQVALTYAATVVVGLAAHQAARPDLIRSPKRVRTLTWEGW